MNKTTALVLALTLVASNALAGKPDPTPEQMIENAKARIAKTKNKKKKAELEMLVKSMEDENASCKRKLGSTREKLDRALSELNELKEHNEQTGNAGPGR